MASYNSTLALPEWDINEQNEIIECVPAILPERFQGKTEAGENSIVTPELSSVTLAVDCFSGANSVE
jgi:hypothetical protein